MHTRYRASRSCGRASSKLFALRRASAGQLRKLEAGGAVSICQYDEELAKVSSGLQLSARLFTQDIGPAGVATLFTVYLHTSMHTTKTRAGFEIYGRVVS